MTLNQIIIAVVIGIPVLLLVILVGEAMIARSGPKEQFINPERSTISLGTGQQKLNYVVLGDSSSAGQGADYQKGIAMQTAQELAKNYQVSFTNFSISGATTADVLQNQIKEGVNLKPDLVLVAISANDLTQLKSTNDIKNNMQQILDQLIAGNCKVKIVVTGTPDMGSIPRFAQPLRWVAGLRTQQYNNVFDQLIQKYNITLAPIAKETGPIFREDNTLFAEDRFHPNERGYAVWTKVLNKAIAEALQSQPEHCQ